MVYKVQITLLWRQRQVVIELFRSSPAQRPVDRAAECLNTFLVLGTVSGSLLRI